MLPGKAPRPMISSYSKHAKHHHYSFPVRFEFLKSGEISQLSDEGSYSAGFLGPEGCVNGKGDAGPADQLGPDCRLNYRYPSPNGMYPDDTNLVLRAWESPAPESDRIYGGFWYRSDLHSQSFVKTLISKIKRIVDEASDEPHITMSKVESTLQTTA